MDGDTYPGGAEKTTQRFKSPVAVPLAVVLSPQSDNQLTTLPSHPAPPTNTRNQRITGHPYHRHRDIWEATLDTSRVSDRAGADSQPYIYIARVNREGSANVAGRRLHQMLSCPPAQTEIVFRSVPTVSYQSWRLSSSAGASGSGSSFPVLRLREKESQRLMLQYSLVGWQGCWIGKGE